jgi:hypothetical protein
LPPDKSRDSASRVGLPRPSAITPALVARLETEALYFPTVLQELARAHGRDHRRLRLDARTLPPRAARRGRRARRRRARQRRRVRGREYSWANVQRLQRALAEAGIGYSHHKELRRRPSSGMCITARTSGSASASARAELAPDYRERYLHEILDQVDLDPLIEELPAGRASALFCVERDPEACHCSLVAERLAEEFGVTVVNLLPEGRR